MDAPSPPGSGPSDRSTLRWLVAAAVVLVVITAVAGVIARRGDGGDSTAPSSSVTTGPPVTSSGPTTTVLPPVAVDPATTGGRTPLAGFGQVLVEVRAADGGTCEACLLLASTAEQRSRGLMEVTDPALGGYDGMLFDFGGEERTGGFWMRNTRVPLEGVFLDVEGRFLASLDMVPCPDATADADCPRYDPGIRYGTVIELAALSGDDLLLGAGSTVEVVGDACPAVLAGR